MYTDLLLIALILTGIFYSGFPYEFEEIISKKLKFGKFKLPKPFGCPLCWKLPTSFLDMKLKSSYCGQDLPRKMKEFVTKVGFYAFM